jgi:GT2 family glycosyltransferase
MPLPANALLQPECSVKPGWGRFDSIWYLKSYGHHLPAKIARTPEGLLTYYLQRGAREGHSPNRFFDEVHYLAANPKIAELINAGRYASGFDHYCQLGHRFHAGHWLFDDALYGSLYEDMSLENLDSNRFYGRYDHYLRAGQFEHRLAHLLFDAVFYAAQAIAAGDDARSVEQLGPFAHFLSRLESGAAELPPSIYFDPDWYADRRKQLLPEREVLPFGSAIAHYLCCSSQDHLDPVPEFSEDFYRRSNPDIRAALEAGIYRSGYQHFLQTGVFELRRPSQGINLAYYHEANTKVRNALNTGAVRDAFSHLRAIGLREGLPGAVPNETAAISEAAASALCIRKTRNYLTAIGRRKLDFTANAPCRVCVIMVISENVESTMLTLNALRANHAGHIQVILVDNGSGDAANEIEHHVTGANIIRLNQNIGYLRACNLALPEVAAESLLFLGNDVALGYGALDAAIARLNSAGDIGAVGAKVIRNHGKLQEAGCIIWRDASTSCYMRDAEPLAGEANFVRDVDFCSGSFLLCRSALIKMLGGFDADFSPAGYQDVDLCVRMAVRGYRIVYDSAIIVHRIGYADGGEAGRGLMQRGQQIFQRKHAAFLRTRPVNSPPNITAARSPAGVNKKILLIEDTVPLRRLGAGYVRANDIVRAMAEAGHSVTLFPVNGGDISIMSMASDLPDNVEVLHDRDIDGFAEFLGSRPGFYDLLWVSRTHNLSRVLPICLAVGVDIAATPLVLDSEAIATVRDAARARLAGIKNFDFEQALQRELAPVPLCRHCVAVNESEAGLLRGSGAKSVSVLGTMRCPDPTPNPFLVRNGLLFVASIHLPDSPNLDALHWYTDEILPALADEMEAPPLLNVAGYVARGIDLAAFADHPQVRIHGAAVSLRPHYEQNRLFIAPTRFAAGTAYKLCEAASFGLPIVATSLLAGQVSWQDGADLLTAPTGDAKRFAAQIARAYRSSRIWSRLRKNALRRIAQENRPEAFDDTVRRILQTACLAPGQSPDVVEAQTAAF